MGQVERIYDNLGMPGFDAVESPLQRYVDSIASYRKNTERGHGNALVGDQTAWRISRSLVSPTCAPRA